MLPNLPTDNLYKFIALSGLALFIFNIYYSNEQITRINDRIYQEKLKVAEWSLNVDFLEEESNEIERIIDSYLNGKENKNDVILDKVIINITKDELIERVNLLNSKRQQAKIESKKIMISLDYTKKLVIKAERQTKRLIILSFVSFFNIILGFSMWYMKLQRPMDNRIKQYFIDSESSTFTKI